MVFRVRILFPDRPDKFPDLVPVFISLCLHCAADICCKCTASFKSALHIFGTQASGQKKWSGKPWNERQVKSFSASSVLSLCIGVKEQILAGQLLRFQDPALKHSACSSVIRRLLFAKTNPIKSGRYRLAVSMSSGRLRPQIFTLLLIGCILSF